MSRGVSKMTAAVLCVLSAATRGPIKEMEHTSDDAFTVAFNLLPKM